MPDPPPLVHFALGALHHRAGNFAQAENHLAFLVEDEKSDEKTHILASSELRSYVRILRKLEREPAEAPQTTAAIRALERSRRHRAAALLSESRQKTQEALFASKLNELAAAPTSAALKEPVKPLLERLEEKSHEAPTAVSPSESHQAQPFITFKINDETKTPNGDAMKNRNARNSRHFRVLSGGERSLAR